MLSNLAKTLHSSVKRKNKQVAEIWGLLLKKQRFGATMQFPEGLENTLFKELLHPRHYIINEGKNESRNYSIATSKGFWPH